MIDNMYYTDMTYEMFYMIIEKAKEFAFENPNDSVNLILNVQEGYCDVNGETVKIVLNPTSWGFDSNYIAVIGSLLMALLENSNMISYVNKTENSYEIMTSASAIKNAMKQKQLKLQKNTKMY